MKKLLSILMSALLLTAGIVTLTACDNVPTPPEGYKAYVGEEVYFAYPDTWESFANSLAIVAYKDNTTGSNVALASEPKSDLYKNMTVA